MPQVDVELRGAPWELLQRLSGAPPYPREFMLDGPRGTGKSQGICHVLYWIASSFPGVRILAIRHTRRSLTESFCVTWEKTVPAGDYCLEGPSRGHRSSYKFSNGAEIILAGMDEPQNLYSTEFDVAFVEEMAQITEDAWERLLGSLRNKRTPFQPIIGATNPLYPSHWTNKRFGPNRTGIVDGSMVRLYSRHTDNPAIADAGGSLTEYGVQYMHTLDGLSGVRRSRLLEGRWEAAEGLVWPQYDPAIHLVSGNVREEGGLWFLDLVGKVDPIELVWFCASVDWGYTAPGCVQVWGVTSDKAAYRIVEIYKTGQTLDWWAEHMAELHKEFRLRGIPCDPSRPESIEKLNDRLGSRGGRDVPRIAFPANNRLSNSGGGDLGGLDQVRVALDPGKDKAGKQLPPKMFFLRNALRFGVDADLVAQSRPTCFEEEVVSYVLMKAAPGKEEDIRLVKDERPDPTCDEHACDTARYGAQYIWQHAFKPITPPTVFKPGTNAYLHGTPASLERERKKREREDGW